MRPDEDKIMDISKTGIGAAIKKVKEKTTDADDVLNVLLPKCLYSSYERFIVAIARDNSSFKKRAKQYSEKVKIDDTWILRNIKQKLYDLIVFAEDREIIATSYVNQLFYVFAQTLCLNEYKPLCTHITSRLFEGKPIRDDYETYFKSFHSKLFLEEQINDGKAACLSDVYVPPRVNTSIGYENKNLFTLTTEFLSNGQIKKRKTLIIMGKPGSGKSSYVSYLATQITDYYKGRDVYYLRLRDLGKSRINSSNPLYGILDKIHRQETHNYSYLENKVLILDGLDEICAMYKDKDFSEYLTSILEESVDIDGLQLIITSRYGYFEFSDKMKNQCVIADIQDWSGDDRREFSEKYGAVHESVKDTLTDNCDYLDEDEEKHKDDKNYKKPAFSVPILFYMAAAKTQSLKAHENVTSLYDAVFKQVVTERKYDGSEKHPLSERIPEKLARQICCEIAFSMFRNGSLNLEDGGEPSLGGNEVKEAIEEAIRIYNADGDTWEKITDDNKKVIHDFYALSFFYNKSNSDVNGVEFAHKSIAEYFTAKKMIQILNDVDKDASEKDFCEALAECFGYMSVTGEIYQFIHESFSVSDDVEKEKIKALLERHFLNSVVYGSIFTLPKNSDAHYIDLIDMMMLPTLRLVHSADAKIDFSDETKKQQFCNVIRRVGPFYSVKFASLLRLNLSDVNLSGADLYGADLYGAVLSGADLSGADLSDAVLSGAVLSDADLSGADLSGVNLFFAALIGAVLSGADLSGADLSGADLSGANLAFAKLRGVIFYPEDFTGKIEIEYLTLNQSNYDYIKEHYPRVKLIDPTVYPD